MTRKPLLQLALLLILPIASAQAAPPTAPPSLPTTPPFDASMNAGGAYAPAAAHAAPVQPQAHQVVPAAPAARPVRAVAPLQAQVLPVAQPDPQQIPPWTYTLGTLCALLSFLIRMKAPEDHWLHQRVGATAVAAGSAFLVAVLTALAQHVQHPPITWSALPWVLTNAGLGAVGALLGGGNPSFLTFRSGGDNVDEPTITTARAPGGGTPVAVLALLLLGGLATLPGCGHFSGHAFGTTLAQCELGRAPGSLQGFIGDATQILEAGRPTYQADLRQLGAEVGVQLSADAISCVVAAAIAGMVAADTVAATQPAQVPAATTGKVKALPATTSAPPTTGHAGAIARGRAFLGRR